MIRTLRSVAFFALLAVALALVGCGSKETTPTIRDQVVQEARRSGLSQEDAERLADRLWDSFLDLPTPQPTPNRVR